jgi:hypothetical protein
MAILFGIDGTGPFSDSEYVTAFKRSFVRQMCSTEENYCRGPQALGGGLPEAIAQGMKYIKGKRLQGDKSPILLTGYSRGALGAVVIAKYLQNENIPVLALLMFDCVDRHLGYDAEYIPNNVENVFHVRRSPAAHSRLSFGNDGTKYSSPTKYEEKFYFGTHGAMGGTAWQPADGQSWGDYVDEGTGEAAANTPYFNAIQYTIDVKNYKTNVTFNQDKAASSQIAKDIQPFSIKFGFPLVSHP